MALLRALVALGYRPHVCHLNHRWRGAASDADARFVRALAGQLGLPVTVGRLLRRDDVPTEDTARRARLAFFERVAKKTGIRTLALAHTADDQAETVLLRLIRGAGPTGLAGMAGERKLGALRIVRPLLGVTRAEVLDYLKAHRLTWREDASNRDLRFLRNRVRHVLLPLLEREFNPGIRRVLCGTAEVMRAEAERDPIARQRREIRQALGNLGFRQVEEVRKRLSAKWPVKVHGRTVIGELEVVLECGGLTPPCRFRKGAVKPAHSKTESFDADALGPRPFIRTWRPGDRFQPLGMQGEKKLQDFFVDEKVPRAERHRVPLLCATDGRIAWVVGYRLTEPFKVTPATKRVLRLLPVTAR
jgi:tRNA(Ile)-lysidine synthase